MSYAIPTPIVPQTLENSLTRDYSENDDPLDSDDDFFNDVTNTGGIEE